MQSVTQGWNQFCGPAVLSIMTGKSTDECAAVLGSIQGRVEVEEVSIDNMLKACHKMRFKTELIPTTKNSSLFYVMSAISKLRDDKSPVTVMAFIRRHVVALELTPKPSNQILFCDNHTKEPINAADSARASQTCLGCYRVIPKPEPLLIDVQYTAERDSYNRILLRKHEIYEDAEDNVTKNVGVITATDEELFLLLQKIGELIHVTNATN